MEILIGSFSAKLRKPFVSNKGRIESVDHVQVTLQADGFCGIGVCRADIAPDLAIIRAIRQQAIGFDVSKPSATISDLEAAIGRNPISVACDIALFDLHSRKLAIPARALFGRPGRHPQTAVTVGVETEEDLYQATHAFRDWPILKIKLRRDQPASLVTTVRKIYAGEIWVDANGGWDIQTAKANMTILEAAGVTILEQPLATGEFGKLSELRGSSVQIAVDEDVRGPESITGLAGNVDIVNIKLAACGGLGGAHATIDAALQAGLKTIIGCRTESVAGVTAASVLAHLAHYVDLDGHLDIADDPFFGITVNKGTVWLTEENGVGATKKQSTSAESFHDQAEMRSPR